MSFKVGLAANINSVMAQSAEGRQHAASHLSTLE
jgi:hypothetical protein